MSACKPRQLFFWRMQREKSSSSWLSYETMQRKLHTYNMNTKTRLNAHSLLTEGGKRGGFAQVVCLSGYHESVTGAVLWVASMCCMSAVELACVL